MVTVSKNALLCLYLALRDSTITKIYNTFYISEIFNFWSIYGHGRGPYGLKGSVWSKKSFPFFAENMTIRSILNLWWHSEILKLILGVVRGMFTKRLKGTRRLLYTVKSDFFEMTALHSKC